MVPVALGIGLRVAGALLVWILFLGALFLAAHVLSDPIQLLTPRDPKTPPELAEANCIRFGLCPSEGGVLPLDQRWWRFLTNVHTGEFGFSYQWRQPIAGLLLADLGATLELLGASATIAIAVGAPLGILSVRRSRRGLDALSRGAGALLYGMPAFWLALLLWSSLSASGPFPASGRIDEDLARAVPFVTGLLTVDALLAARPDALASAARHLALPALALGLPSAGLVARSVRRYAIPDPDGVPGASAPTFPVGGFLFAAILVEAIFARGGLGGRLRDALVFADVPTVLGATAVLGALGIALAVVVSIPRAIVEGSARAPLSPRPEEPPPTLRGRLAEHRATLVAIPLGVALLAGVLALAVALEAHPALVAAAIVLAFLVLGVFTGWLEARWMPPAASVPRVSPDVAARRVARAERRFGAGARVLAAAGAVLLVGLLGVSALAPFLAPHDPGERTGDPFEPPGPDHPLGTDSQGADVLSRVLYGGRPLLLAVGVSLLPPFAIGAGYAFVLGRAPRRRAAVLGGLLDPVRGLPEIFVLGGFALVVNPGPLGSPEAFPAVATVRGLVIGLALTPAFLVALGNRFGGAAVLREPLGLGGLAGRRLLAFPPLLAALAAEVVLLVGALGFLGWGSFAPADWGVDLGRGAGAWPVGGPLLFVAPGLMIFLLAASLLLLGEGLGGLEDVRGRPEAVPARPPSPVRQAAIGPTDKA